MEPPIHTEYLRSGGATTLIFMVDGANAVSSLVMRSPMPANIVVPPLSASILCGLVAPSFHRSAPSNRCGSPRVNMMSQAPRLSIGSASEDRMYALVSLFTCCAGWSLAPKSTAKLAAALYPFTLGRRSAFCSNRNA